VSESLTEAGLTPEVLRRLQRLTLQSVRDQPGNTAGMRRSPRTGSSLEFADFRSYSPGDDVRRVDWRAYARSGRLMVKLFHGEEDIAVTIWLDVSASMCWGKPEKLGAARAIGAALAYVGLHSYDRVSVCTFGGSAAQRLAVQRGRRSFQRIWDFLNTAETGGDTGFAELGRFGERVPRGISVVVSDFLSEDDIAASVRTLSALHQSVHLIQVLAPEELEPRWSGNLRFRDAESDHVLDVTTSREVLKAYTTALRRHVEQLREVAAECQATFHQLPSSDSIGSAIDRLREDQVLA
jgi:uncharacterized protein (DUF58 family)